jgi:chitodextrinase
VNQSDKTCVAHDSPQNRAVLLPILIVCAIAIPSVLVLSTSIALGQTTASWAHVQTAARNSGARTNVLTFPTPTQAGNLIVVEVDWTSEGPGLSAISDNQGNVYKQVGTEQRSANFWTQSRLYYAANIRGGPTTITTVVAGGSSYHELYIHEYAGLDPVAPLDAFSVQVASGTTFSSGAITTTAPHDLLYGIEIDSSAGTAAAGWTTRARLNSTFAADADAATAGTYSFTGNAGGAFIAWIVAFKQAAPTPPNPTPPTVPSGLSAVATSSTQILVSWLASTDPNDPASQLTYKVLRNGVPIATTAAGVTSYQDTGLAPATTYSYAVSASDPAGHTSAPSSSVQATTLAAPVPVISSFIAIPSTITAGLPATLSWQVSNATSVRIDPNVGDVTGRTSTSVSPAATVTYTLTATNSNGLVATQTTLQVTPDTEPPSVPSNLSADPQSSTQIDLAWWASTDNVAVSGYRIFRDGVAVATAPTTTYTDTGLVPGTTYTYTVSAYDAAGNESAKSGGVSATTQSQSSAPSYTTTFPVPENPISDGGRWINGKVVGVDWTDVTTTTGLAFGTQSGFDGFNDSIAVLQGNWGADQWAAATVYRRRPQVPSADEEVELLLRFTLAPHVARGYEVLFSVGAFTNLVAIVRWNGALGDFSVLDTVQRQHPIADGDVVKATITGNTITAYVNNVAVLQSTDSTFASGNPGLGFFFQANGALGGNTNSDFGFTSYTASSNSVASAPSVPTNLVASPASSSAIALSWSASTGVVGPVAGYNVFRDGIQVGQSTSTTYNDQALSASTSYSYAISAYDVFGNTSSQSSPVHATTLGLAGRVWAHVQTEARNSGSSSNALPFGWPTTAGNLILVQVDWSEGATFNSISDSQGNVYTQAGSEQRSSSIGVRSRLYYAANIRGGATTITTVVNGSPAYHELYIHEYSGLDRSAPLDAFSVRVASGTTFTSGSITTTAAHDLLYGIEIDSSVGHASAAWTTRSTLDSNVAADVDAPTVGTYQFSGSSSGSYVAWIVAFKQAP